MSGLFKNSPFIKNQVRLSKRGYYFGATALVIALFCLFEYTQQEETPVTIKAPDVAELFVKGNKHWVRMSGLQVDCAKTIDVTKDGNLERRFYVATDDKNQTFILENKGPCSADPGYQYVGVLERDAGSHVRNQISGTGVLLPGGALPHLSVGETPSGLWKQRGFL